VNHFLNNIEITKKSGLQKNLRNMVYKNIDIDNFYPRSYELSERNDFEDFLEDFKTMKAVALIKQFHSGQRDNMKEEILLTALSTMDRKLTYFENYEEESLKIIWDRNSYFLNARNQKLISDSEWFCISEEDVRNYTKEIEKLEKMNKIGYLKIEKDKKLSSTKINFTNKENNSLPLSDNPEVLQKYKEIISSYIQRMQNILPQFYLNGANNIWILKPSGLSRGRGIICMNSLNDILDLIKKNSNQYIAQKYIENPLIILGRKFDIRQWVLVTDLNPLTIWMYDTPYVRFGAEDYKLEDFSNLFSHLTNNSVVKYSKNFNDTKIEGNMWDCSQLSDFLKANHGRDVWKEELQEKIKKIVICSLESAKNGITQRKNSHELFGYDFMVDDQLNSWLIEVNSSPAMDYSTSITEKLVKEMSEDLIKVVVDHNLADKNERPQINTGKWIKIHEGKFEEENFLPNLNN
jgi:tubulin monoglycylase TTLL3/8